jgi:hypothetical protein
MSQGNRICLPVGAGNRNVKGEIRNEDRVIHSRELQNAWRKWPDVWRGASSKPREHGITAARLAEK